MLVFRSEERLREGAVTATVEQYEALTLGIAVDAKTVLEKMFDPPWEVHS